MPPMRRQILTVLLSSCIAYAAGFCKLWLIARLFGAGVELDGYYLAMTLPGFFSGIVSGFVQVGFFPVRARLANTSPQEAVECFERMVLSLNMLIGFIGALVLAILAFIASPLLASFGAQPRSLQTAMYVLPYALLMLPLNGLGHVMGYLLAFRGRYYWYAAAPVANALLAAGLLLVWPEGGLFNLALGTFLGLALEIALCAWALSYSGFRLIGPLFRFGKMGQQWREMLRLGGWMLPGLLFANLTATLPTVFAASHGEGAVATFGYAWRLHTYATQLSIMTISPVILAKFSELVARGNLATVWGNLRKALWISIVLGLVAVAGIGLFGAAFLEWAFGGKGRFNASVAHAVAGQWFVLALALCPIITSNVNARFFTSYGRTHLLSLMSAIGVVVFLAVAVASAKVLGLYAVPVAVAASAFVVAAVSWERAAKIMKQQGVIK
jgi:peptidoglycan biosynthesis protein MviN/MurJ (putative lipid II flippase)